MPELKNCPFCGGDATAPSHLQHKPGCYFDVLANLKAAPRGDCSLFPALADAWNKRAQPAGEAVEWTNNAEANSALLMLDRLDTSPDDDVRVDAIAATIRRLAAESKPVGYAENMTAGFTIAVFDATSIPVGTPLYAAPPAAANQAGIPEGLTVSQAPTSQYAKGWNDCIKAFRATSSHTASHALGGGDE